MKKVERYLLDRISRDGAIHLTLLDPEKFTPQAAFKTAKEAEAAGTTAIMVGGSTAISSPELDKVVKEVSENIEIPIILFPGNITGICPHADAVWFMSLLNSRDPYFIIGAQALGATLVKRYGLEPIPMGYIIVNGGGTAGLIGQASPVPYNMPDVAAIYALAAQYLGMRFVYLEAGSGAEKPVPPEMISKVRKLIDIPLIVGGGIKTGEDASRIVKAGADAIVTGTVVEVVSKTRERINELVQSIRLASKARVRT